ncbi:FtsQ-type POTRA domain-containing protein [Macrococcus carouselicus]|uniref:Cell division protein DivIB n=1 Tax=Macrococcus carouselicus TaxID=69969 RepID=A0A9Q8CN19_9STAP|nr:FtsQ-type POTRA domain-containing protein [Macrococcus carouselicus]TDM03939.1 FtsQ-type POTRA domain-containing protein [Macrococcus carouselicus]
MSAERLKQGGRQQRKRKHRLQLGIFLAVTLVVTLVLLYMFTSISYVKEVSIRGNAIVTDKKVEEILNLGQNSRIYTLPISEMEQNLKMQDGVKHVTIKPHFPNRLSVDIDEYKVRAIVADGSDYRPVLENGQILKNQQAEKSGPILNDFEGSDLVRMIDVLNKTDVAVRSDISEINFMPNREASSRVQIFMNDGLEVIGDLRTLGDKLDYYPGMAKDVPRDQNGNLIKPGIIDLEVGAVFIPYESKKAEEKRLEIESELAAKKERDKKKHDKEMKELQKKVEQSKTKKDD